ncbi:chromate efflux transporter [Duganella sp. FT50W]|uniref:Chromate efflux transporter n=1 Tax=Duganella lactea TaxID=2692173 RepID=A0A6L8MQ09_9BURK|nr:chromate efflux transporter [Duganella lactea]MYM84456.1 chromate efflux transporter [Duganella lactea]
MKSSVDIFLAFLRLGLTSFGGPVAHLGYFREEFVHRRRWLGEPAYADLVALCQFLPGPASSQVGIALGLLRGGYAGAMAAFLGFTLPSAILLVVFGLGLATLPLDGGWLHGLKVVAVAVVAQALWGMGKTLTPDRPRATLAIAAATAATLLPSTAGQIGAILIGGVIGWAFLRVDTQLPHATLPVRTSRRTGAGLLIAYLVLLLVLPALAAGSDSYAVKLFAGFYHAGALVFGGGHVILPLLQAQVVPPGWVSNDAFLAGYGAAQAVPGPLSTFAAYLGAVSTQSPAGWLGAAIALSAIFLPAFLLVMGALPFWESLRRHDGIRRAMPGINAAVVGLLLAAFHHPVWTSAILSGADFCLAAAAFLLLVFWKWPPWLVVVLSATIGGFM